MKINLLLLFVLAFVLNACQQTSSKYIYNNGLVYGTMYSIIYQSPNEEDFQTEITELFRKYTMIFSNYEPESTISKINKNENTDIEPEFITCFKRAMEVSEITNGAFDITAGSLINAWGFGPDEKEKMTQEIVDSLLQNTGYKKIRLQNSKIQKDIAAIKIDMNAISKGYTSDLIANFLKEKGCENYMVEIGGEVVAKGKSAKRKIWGKRKIWTIGISKPEDGTFGFNSELQAKVQLHSRAMATSGNYRNFYVVDGKKYAHTIDPKTGYPVQHSLLSATVIANNCMTADAFATAFMVLGMDLGIEIAHKLQEIEVYFIYSDETGNNQVYLSEGFDQYLVE